MPDRKKISRETRGGCICEPCPSYNECMRANEELMFCVKGKTPDCTFDRKGCHCPECPSRPLKNPAAMYFCARGSDHHR